MNQPNEKLINWLGSGFLINNCSCGGIKRASSAGTREDNSVRILLHCNNCSSLTIISFKLESVVVQEVTVTFNSLSGKALEEKYTF